MSIPLPIVAAVLFGALCNASWNLFVKRGDDRFLASVLLCLGCGVLGAIGLLVLPPPAAASWPFIAASVAAQVGYITLLAAAYEAGDFGQAYPMMRGTAPLLVALVSGPLIGEPLSLGRWCGVGLISGGVVAMSFIGSGSALKRAWKAPALALGTAALIATYTVIDGIGVRQSGAPLSYAFTTFALTAVPLVGWTVLRRGRAFVDQALRRWRIMAFGGLASFVSYGIALWAMARAPVAVVASLRETSILFATALSIVVLKEGIIPARLAATALIVLGAVAVRGF
ncbi:EamA family transporter [Lichenihabitans sp. Uapishka_5]|uniref:EamA family transporter n=1 Tax=Lichenihabitans sp. Uapishka_5 TaxID=3037302 RepID=UPI0029E805CC|nr:EamA family transporter [Lichenihabitans sp. Uapishka_5]MDX7952180.1 EamA family transporter [Lichenihabitans sp. Uapishka_5]